MLPRTYIQNSPFLEFYNDQETKRSTWSKTDVIVSSLIHDISLQCNIATSSCRHLVSFTNLQDSYERQRLNVPKVQCCLTCRRPHETTKDLHVTCLKLVCIRIPCSCFCTTSSVCISYSNTKDQITVTPRALWHQLNFSQDHIIIEALQFDKRLRSRSSRSTSWIWRRC